MSSSHRFLIAPSLRRIASGRWIAAALLFVLATVPRPGLAFTLFESGQVRPLALSPDGTRLFAVNTPDNRLEIFSVGGAGLTHLSSVEVGLEPVAVAARSNSEVWVVNHLSDSVSIVDVSSARVTRTLLVGDEPRDIVFAGSVALGAGAGQRAFITTARRGQNTTVPPLLTTEGTPRALVFVFDAVALASDTSLTGTPLTVIPLFGDTPRALARNVDGSRVYAGIFHSGNQTTAISEGAVCDDSNLMDMIDDVEGPCVISGQSVPGGLPKPERVGGVPRPETGIIVKYNNLTADWEDQEIPPRAWDNVVRFDLPDYDVFTIDADAGPPAQLGPDTAQHAHVGTILFNMLANPSNNKIYVTNTEAVNEVRFEGEVVPPFDTVRSRLHQARITVLDGANVNPRHLNKHLDYSDLVAPTTDRDASLATPMGMALSGTNLYVAAFGSQKIGVFDTVKLEADTFDPDPQDGELHISLSGGGPTGMVFDGANNRLYVLTRFDNSIAVINTLTNAEVLALKRSLYNPEPDSIVDGRPFLYDAVLTSSNGEASCSSCHVFGDFDSLSWDLGDPNTTVLDNQNPLVPGLPSQNPDFHPLKGPMNTQSLRGMANHGPMHWRGDRTGGLDEANAQPDGGAFDEDLAFKKFNGAFPGLLGRAGVLTAGEMQAFTDFILQVTYPPNPIRALSNSLSGPAALGNNMYFNVVTDSLTCNGCHVLDQAQGFFGSDGRTSFEAEPQMFKVAHLRNMYQKVGMFGMPTVFFFLKPGTAHLGPQVRGFGFLHDGSVDTIDRFHSAFVFDFPTGLNNTERAQLEAFMFEFDSNMAPIVGQQTTVTPANYGVMDVQTRLNLLEARAAANECEVVVKGTVGSEQRGYYRLPGGSYQSDRAAEPVIPAGTLRLEAQTAGQELTYTCVPPGSGERIGVDRDEDGCFDTDEIDGGSDPANPLSNACGGSAAPATSKKLLIKNKVPEDEPKNKIVVLSKDTGISTPAPLSAADPRCNGDLSGTVKASITISSATSTHTHTAPLPCQNWSLLGSASNPKGYKYGDAELDQGTAKKVKWQNGKQLKAILQGKGPSTLDYDLVVGTDEGQVAVAFTTLAGGICLSCDDYNGKNGSDGKTFLGKDCPAPPSCP